MAAGKLGTDAPMTHRFVDLAGTRAIPKIAILSPASPTGETGGAERLYSGLVDAFENRGLRVEHVGMTMDESDFPGILDGYIRFYDIDLSDYDGVVSTKSPSYMVRHRNHVCLLPHTIRSFYDMFTGSCALSVELKQARIIWNLDRAALSRPHLKKLFCVGAEVQERLKRFLNIESEVLHHPSTLKTIRDTGSEYLLIPGRLHPWKRVDLAIEAVKRMKNDYPVVICGTGEEETRLRALAADRPRISFSGYIDDEQLARYYASATAVIFCPVREDFGLVAVEAFSSGKPIVTCTDSGEPARLVNHGYNGMVSSPDPESLSVTLDRIVTDVKRASVLGSKAAETVRHVTWDSVSAKLLHAPGFDQHLEKPC
ncbi:MAG: glycosyltransferase [Proteobacteria bacterium]|nr:MAG: glycosyltransferase [Pseudomonadota bacterium]